MISALFKLKENHTTIKKEVVAGLTTFLTMAYVIIVNPILLSQAGLDKGSVFVATCLVAIVGCLVMGLIANYPIAVAPSMGLVVYFVYTVVLAQGYSWQEALGTVFASGILFMILNLLNIRQAIVHAIPISMKFALSAGVGLFLAFIALKSAGVISPAEGSFVRLSHVQNHTVVLSFIGFVSIIALEKLRIPGAILLGILITTFLGMAFGYDSYQGIVSLPPSILPTMLHLDFSGVTTMGFWVVVFTLFYVAFFDCTGTLIGVTQNTHLVDSKGNMKNMRRALVADSIATLCAGLLGTSAAGSYLESAAGVRAGGRTGLTACVIAVLFVLSLLFSPLIKTIPAFATAPALLFVACLMTQGIAHLDWDDLTETVPSILTIILMPLTFSIANGIAAGLLTYVAVKVCSGRFRDLNAILIFLAALSGIYLCSAN